MPNPDRQKLPAVKVQTQPNRLVVTIERPHPKSPAIHSFLKSTGWEVIPVSKGSYVVINQIQPQCKQKLKALKEEIEKRYKQI